MKRLSLGEYAQNPACFIKIMMAFFCTQLYGIFQHNTYNLHSMVRFLESMLQPTTTTSSTSKTTTTKTIIMIIVILMKQNFGTKQKMLASLFFHCRWSSDNLVKFYLFVMSQEPRILQFTFKLNYFLLGFVVSGNKQKLILFCVL